MTNSVGSLCWWSTSHFDCQCEFCFFLPPVSYLHVNWKTKFLKLLLLIWLKRNKIIKITKAQMADLQQQAGGHRFESMVECKCPEIFLVLMHWKFLPAFTKGFSRFLQRYGKYFSQECPWTLNKDGCTYKTHTLCTVHFEHTADRQGPWNAMII